eukprot:scaffold8777_cov130-Isochrysis_galbana.AAC.1
MAHGHGISEVYCYSVEKKESPPTRVEGNDGAPTAPPGADRGRHGLGQGLETSTIAPPSDCLWHRLALHIALLALAGPLARAPALGKGSECSKDPFGGRSTPLYYHSFKASAVHYNTLRGFPIFNLNFDSFVKFKGLHPDI